MIIDHQMKNHLQRIKKLMFTHLIYILFFHLTHCQTKRFVKSLYNDLKFINFTCGFLRHYLLTCALATDYFSFENYLWHTIRINNKKTRCN